MSNEASLSNFMVRRARGLLISSRQHPNEKLLQIVRIGESGLLSDVAAFRTHHIDLALSRRVQLHALDLVQPKDSTELPFLCSVELSFTSDDYLYTPEALCPVPNVVAGIRDLIAHMEIAPLRLFICEVLHRRDVFNAFWTMPASRAHHHARAGGLAQHSFEVASDVACNSQLTDLERELGLAGALLHDIGKVWAYTKDMFPSAEAKAMGHELLGLSRLAGDLDMLQRQWPDGAHAMRAILSGNPRPRENGSLPPALIARIKACDQRSCERDLARSGGRISRRSWIPMQWAPDEHVERPQP